MKLSIKAKSLMFFCSLFIALSVSIGFFAVKELTEIGQKLVGEQALSIVKAFSYQIDGDKFEKLSKDQNSSENSYTLKLNKLMDKIKTDTGCTYIYAMTKISDTQYKYILSDDGETGDTEDISTYDEVFKNSMEGKSGGYTSVEDDEKYGAMLSAVVPIKNSSGKAVGILACDFLANSVEAKINFVKIGIIVMAVLILFISCLLTYFLMRLVFKRLNLIVEITNKVSEGDLTVKISDNKKDEFGKLASNFNTMISKLYTLVIEIKQMTEVIDNNAANLSSASEEVYSSSNCASDSIGRISEGISDQTRELIEISNFIHTFGENMNEMNLCINQIEGNAGKISEKSDEGTKAISKLSSSAENVADTFTGARDRIISLDENIRKISDMTELIRNIATQTNLLALNASIEAARAGEAGKGFSVVADEIKKLSQMTKSSSDEIVKKIYGIRNETSDVIDNFRHLDNSIEEQLKSSDESMHVFTDIINRVDEIIPQIEHMSEQALLLNREKEEVISRIQTASEISKGIEVSSNEIYSSSQEIYSASEEVAASAEILNGLTSDIIKKVGLFKI